MFLQNWNSIIHRLHLYNKMLIKPWREAVEKTEIACVDVQIWSAYLDQEDSSDFLNLLSVDEKSRAERLKSQHISDNQIISRGILRLLLGKYLNIAPEKIDLGTGRFGKPFLITPTDSPISFNLAHSGSLALFAFGKAKGIGVDVEKNDETRDFAGISSIVFSIEEQKFLSKSKDPISDFYSLWTAKEAILKVSGRGFSYPSNKFSVVLTKGIPSEIKIPTELSGGFSSLLTSFSPAPGYSAAIAVQK
jgi:4'-phosphopantetheinyl transferase